MKPSNPLLFMALASLLLIDVTASDHGSSRFLADADDPRYVSCKKNPYICNATGAAGPTCCANKCVDTTTDNNNCGRCGLMCEYTEACCRGECVDLAFDKRHCGYCNHRCKEGDYCIYGLCNY